MENHLQLGVDLTGIILVETNKEDMGRMQQHSGIAGSESIIQRQVRILRQICTEVILVTSTPRLYLPLVDRSVRIITNLFPGKGWLGGMYSALSLSKNINLWIVGNNMPFISPQAAKIMLRSKRIRENEVVIPFIDGIAHPLHGIYDKQCIDAVSFVLGRANSTIKDLLDIVSVQYIDKSAFDGKGVDMRFIQVMIPNEASV